MSKLLITNLKNNLTLDPLSKELLDNYSKFDLTNVVTLYYQKGIHGQEFPHLNLIKSKEKESYTILVLIRDNQIFKKEIMSIFITLEDLESVFESIREDNVYLPLEKMKDTDRKFVVVDYKQEKYPNFSTTIHQEKLSLKEIKERNLLKDGLEFSNFLNIALDDFENEEEIIEAIKNWAKER